MEHAANDGAEHTDGLSGLTPTEDRELRQLTWFARAGSLSEPSLARMSDLVARDRRREVRDARPNPNTPAAEEATTLPPLQMDSTDHVSCPNCGTLLRAVREHGPSQEDAASGSS